MASWDTIGNVGNIRKINDTCWIIDIADNIYDYNDKTKKIKTVWLNCICNYCPKVKVGDRVIVSGVIDNSSNDDYKIALIIKHIGVIPPSGD